MLRTFLVAFVLSSHYASAFAPLFRIPQFAPASAAKALRATAESAATTPLPEPPHVVVVGAGWGGWGASKSLLESGCRVTLLDTQEDPTGRTPMVNKNGKPVDAGQRGFWKDYPNIERMVSDLGLSETDVWTEFTNSSFYSPSGLEATAPVFSKSPFPTLPSPVGQILATFPLFERLPLSDRASMAGLLAATLDCLAFDEGGDGPDSEVLAAYDRMSAHGKKLCPLGNRRIVLFIPLMSTLSNIAMTAIFVVFLLQFIITRHPSLDLFIKFGLSERLVKDFITPTLLVGLFKPPHELSALVTMELLYYYALAHQDSFDVRWIKSGTVASSLIAPLATRLLDEYPEFTVLGGCAVTEVAEASAVVNKAVDGSKNKPPARATTKKWAQVVKYKDFSDRSSGKPAVDKSIDDAAGVVLALGAKGMTAVVNGSPLLANEPPLSAAASNSGIDVISVRLWLDRVVPTRTPANVFASFPELRGAGGTFFMLDQLQVTDAESEAALWGEEMPSSSSSSSSSSSEDTTDSTVENTPWTGPRGSVLACDFYNSGALMGLTEDELCALLLDELLPAAVPSFKDAQAVDSWVGKYPGAVSWFKPGSYATRPMLHGAGRDKLPNVKCAGDWVKLGAREHGAKGLCQERAFVAGLEAANALLEDLGPVATTSGPSDKSEKSDSKGAPSGEGSDFKRPRHAGKRHRVLSVRPDEPQVVAGWKAARRLPKALRYWVR